MKVYIIGPADGPYKVGIAKNVAARLSALQTSTHQRLMVHAHFDAGSREAAREAEIETHRRLKPFRLSGEWFSCSLDQALSAAPQFELGPDGGRLTGPRSRDDIYRALYELAAQVPEPLRAKLAEQVGAKDSTPEAIAQARVDEIMPRSR